MSMLLLLLLQLWLIFMNIFSFGIIVISCGPKVGIFVAYAASKFSMACRGRVQRKK